ncbi:MAG: hypothetical protein ABID45_01200 [Patescibacteria group bacterium]
MENTPKIKTENNDLTSLYFKKLLLPGLVALIFEIAALFLDNSLMLIWLANSGLILYISWTISNDKKANIKNSFWIPFTALLIISFIVALTKLFIYWKFWYFLNLLTEPLIYAIIGGVICYLIILVISKLKN